MFGQQEDDPSACTACGRTGDVAIPTRSALQIGPLVHVGEGVTQELEVEQDIGAVYAGDAAVAAAGTPRSAETVLVLHNCPSTVATIGATRLT